MQPIQAFSIGVTASHLLLLILVYAYSGSALSSSYISTQMGKLLEFKILLTITVSFEQIMGATYTFVNPSQPRSIKVTTAACFALAATGWILLASYPEDSQLHLGGAAAYIASTSLYSLFFIIAARSLKVILLIFWTLSTSTAIAFGSVYMAQLYPEAAQIEWAAFALYAFTLLLFFSSNQPPEQETQLFPPPESTTPLLPLHRKK